jgi:Cu+-exporting ATPase
MKKNTVRTVLVGTAAVLWISALAYGHDPKRMGSHSGMMAGCAEHHLEVMKASEQVSAHLAEAKRSTTIAEMRRHVDMAEQSMAEMKNHMNMCAEMMEKMHGGAMGGGKMGSGMKSGEEKAAGRVIDPVCGMEVDPKTAVSAAYKGETYYFCSADDKAKFEKEPEKFVKKTG